MINNSISIVIPAYNEEKYIENTLCTISDYLNKNFANFEIIIVDDGSSDNTFFLVSQLSKKIPNLKVLKNSKNRGKGYSVRKGVLAANFDYILFSDADLSTPIEELGMFIEHFLAKEVIVMGSLVLWWLIFPLSIRLLVMLNIGI